MLRPYEDEYPIIQARRLGVIGRAAAAEFVAEHADLEMVEPGVAYQQLMNAVSEA